MNYVTISSKSHSETICGSKKIQWLLSQKWNAITVKYVSYGRYIDGGDFDLSICKYEYSCVLLYSIEVEYCRIALC